ncbi:MAG: hypothetical protein WBQ14_06335 [Gaiellaceae bacterium]
MQSNSQLRYAMPDVASDQLGFVRGRHFTEYVEDVKQLKREGRHNEAERLLFELVDATETESKVKQWGVAPWYYEQLAIIYRKLGERQKEIEILERYQAQRHAPGVKPPELLRRLEKARELARTNESTATSSFPA